MELSLVAVGGVVSVVAVALLSRRVGIAAPLSLVLAGAAIGALPGFGDRHRAAVDPRRSACRRCSTSAAINMPTTDFRRNLKPITGLAVLLVVVSTGIVGPCSTP